MRPADAPFLLRALHEACLLPTFKQPLAVKKVASTHHPNGANLMSHRLNGILLLCLAGFAIFGAPVQSAKPSQQRHNTLTQQEIADGWILLFDGETTFGWQASSKANWQVKDGVISVSEGEKGLLNTTTEFADYMFRVDFRAPAKTNSGIFLRSPTKPSDPGSDCYELNIAAPDVSPFPTGSFVGRKKGDAEEFNSEWRTYEVTAEGGHFVVKLDGRQVLDYTDEKPLGRGFIGLQLNEGPVDFRNIKLKPLGLKSIFNGRDLSGWKVFPGKSSVYSVTDDGHLNVKDGPGQIETEGRYGDLVLQLEVFSNGKHLNSGIFFRSIPGEFWNGYESQIQNGYKDGDRMKPADFGTGAIYRRQPARRVVADDFEWFSKTVVAHGPHIATWVNGYQVVDWTDTRAAHANPRNGLRREAGTLIIQGHDPTTDLSFRNINVAEMPQR